MEGGGERVMLAQNYGLHMTSSVVLDVTGDHVPFRLHTVNSSLASGSHLKCTLVFELYHFRVKAGGNRELMLYYA